MKKILSNLLVLLMVISVVGCNNNEISNEPSLELWSATALEKIMRDDEYANKKPASLSYEMAKNEVEGAQFIITPRDGYEVKSFTVSISELKNKNGKTIPKDDVKIYLQKYINVTNEFNLDPSLHTGYIPDALLPFDKAIEYGENKVEGVNQGIYVTVETQPDTEAGNYTGTATLCVDGKNYSIPVDVTVWDFAISEEVHIGSIFSIWQQELIYGELNSSNEMYALYYDFLAEHRLSAGSLLSSFWYNYTVDEYVAEVKRVSEDPRIATYCLPYRDAYGQDTDYEYIKSILKSLILESKEDAELIDKATYFFGAIIDEPEYYTGRYALAHRIMLGIDNMEEEIIAELEEEGYFDKFNVEVQEEIKEKIRKIPNILTASYTQTYKQTETEFGFGECTYCPLFEQFDGYNEITGEENVELYQRLKDVSGSLWWYGCNWPIYPYPSYHLDASLLNSRIIGTMQYDYKIDGNLYWCVNFASQQNEINNGDIVRASNPYEDAARNTPTSPSNGEGYLLYPGLDYGIKGPIGSLRLEAIRDGNEDYEYYYLLNQLTEELSKYYDTEITTEDMVSNLYDRLYKGVKVVPDIENFYKVKRELAAIIERCTEDNKLVVNGIKYAGENATIEFLAASDYNVKVNGQTLNGTKQGQGKQYTYTLTMDKDSNVFEIELEKDGKITSVEVLAGGKTKMLSSFDSEEELSVLGTNDEKVQVSFNDNEDFAISEGSAKVIIDSKFNPDDPFATLLYHPQLTIDVEENELNFLKMDSLVFNVYNANDFDVVMRIKLKVSDAIDYTVQEIVLKEKQWTNIKIDNIYLTNWSSLAYTKQIVFEFNDSIDNKNEAAMPQQVLYFEDLMYTEKVG